MAGCQCKGFLFSLFFSWTLLCFFCVCKVSFFPLWACVRAYVRAGSWREMKVGMILFHLWAAALSARRSRFLVLRSSPLMDCPDRDGTYILVSLLFSFHHLHNGGTVLLVSTNTLSLYFSLSFSLFLWGMNVFALFFLFFFFPTPRCWKQLLYASYSPSVFLSCFRLVHVYKCVCRTLCCAHTYIYHPPRTRQQMEWQESTGVRAGTEKRKPLPSDV